MSAHKRLLELLKPFAPFRSQPATDWLGREDLPADVQAFYEHVGPWGEVRHENVGPVGCMLNVGGNPVRIPPLHKLAALQVGYAQSAHGPEPLAGWDTAWLVVAEQGGDPFIFHRRTGEVSFALHGTGSWHPVPFASDLTTAVGILATVAVTYSSLDDDEHFEDCELTTEGREIITASLASYLGDRYRAQAALSAWGTRVEDLCPDPFG